METTTINRRTFLAGAAGAAIAAAAGAGIAHAGEAPQSWDATYDVVVIGYGVAGGTAARHAADAGASVLLVDGAPDGAEGGNSKFAKQLLASGHDVENAVTYLKALNAGFEVDEDVLRTFAENAVEIPAYCAEYLGADVHSWIGRTDDPVLAPFVPEYPELPGTETFDAYTISETSGDGAVWLKTKELVEERADSIEVWTASPALHLVQDPATKAVVGVVVEHEGSELGVGATNGVVLACGGFEFNPQMIQDYLGASRLNGIGPIDTYLERLERQRDVAQAKVDNLYALRSVITEALPPDQAPLHLVECPPWLLFFDTPLSERPKTDADLDPRFANRYAREAKGTRSADPFVPLLFNNRTPSPVFEIYIPVEKAGEGRA